MIETQPVDEVGDIGVLTALREGRADIPRRNLEIVAGSLTVKLRVEVELLILDDLENSLTPTEYRAVYLSGIDAS